MLWLAAIPALFFGQKAGPDYARHAAEVRRRLPEAGFTVIVQPPFVIIGNDPPEAVQGYAEHTVRWAVDRLKSDYFTRDPDEIVDIWLFKDAQSYRSGVRKLFGEAPETPFGYYSAAHHALVMNIATGGGTLVHEIVHPFIQANFPDCPPWFNEGMGSLYEQCEDRNGHIRGLTNWRLEGLQKAIRRHKTLPFARLMAQDADAFYNRDTGVNYSQSRYLCYYLQEKGLLRKYYRAFLANRKADSLGIKTLKQTLGTRDIAAFQRRWETFVLDLRFP